MKLRHFYYEVVLCCVYLPGMTHLLCNWYFMYIIVEFVLCQHVVLWHTHVGMFATTFLVLRVDQNELGLGHMWELHRWRGGGC